jgi:hypothetical protein
MLGLVSQLPKIPVGDQPSDIERQIRNLVLDYISKPNRYVCCAAAFVFASTSWL